MPARLSRLSSVKTHARHFGLRVDHEGIRVVAHMIRLAEDRVDGDLRSRGRRCAPACSGPFTSPAAYTFSTLVRILCVGHDARAVRSRRRGSPGRCPVMLARRPMDNERLVARHFQPACRPPRRRSCPFERWKRPWCSAGMATPFFSYSFCSMRADFAVGRARDVIEHLDNRDLAARGGVVSGHFQADHAAADDGQAVSGTRVQRRALSRLVSR